jgi:hypothetical protein
MGMYDTFLFKNPIFCPICGEKHMDVQSKLLSCDLKEFKIGSRIKEYKNAILREELICFGKTHNDNLHKLIESNFSYPIFVFIVIDNHKFIGVYPSDYMAYFMISGDEDDYELVW